MGDDVGQYPRVLICVTELYLQDLNLTLGSKHHQGLRTVKFPQSLLEIAH